MRYTSIQIYHYIYIYIYVYMIDIDNKTGSYTCADREDIVKTGSEHYLTVSLPSVFVEYFNECLQ